MAASERLALAAVMVSATLLIMVCSCAQVTGLSDEYRYDLGDAASGTDASEVDAGANAGDRCDSTDRTRTQSMITEAGGERIASRCRSCMAANCCDEIQKCAQTDECTQSMKCVFGCQQSGGGKNQCIKSCNSSFDRLVGACLQTHCPVPTCQLQ